MKKRLIPIALAVLLAPACVLHARTVGSHDPEVEIAKANAQSEVARAQAQLAMMKALVDALTRLGTPMPLCLSTDGVTIEACKERAK